MKLKTRIVCLLLCCCFLFTISLMYFMIFFDDKMVSNRHYNESKKPLIIVPFTEVRKKNSSLNIALEQIKKIDSKLKSGKFQFQDSTDQLRIIVNQLKSDLFDYKNESKSPWKIAGSWVQAREIMPKKAPQLGFILNSLRTSPITFAGVSKKGTQLKLMIELQGKQKALFKPMRYKRDEIIGGEAYAGADRHNGEIVAFHLSRLLNMPFVPIVTSRIVHVDNEIKKVASPSLLTTFLSKNNRSCFYGECYYCNEYDPVCSDENGLLEGAIVMFLPLHYQLEKLRNPWQRTYKNGVLANWETNPLYCDYVMKRISLKPRILDLIDVSVFDYLIGNADRHHYEVFKDVPNSMILFLDNGKSFGSPHSDEITILAPLYQCCVIRNSTFQRLKLLSSSPLLTLSNVLNELLSFEPVTPLLTKSHLESLDRRLKTILAVIFTCFDEKSIKEVIK